MISELIARKRIYENDPRRVHDRILLSDETKVYADIREWKEQNNLKKADCLFSELNKFALPSKDNCYDRYQGIKQIDAIELINGDLHITSTTECTERDGWEICGISLDRVIMFEIHTENNRVIRFDFQGMIDNENSYEATYTHQITDNNYSVHNSSEIKTKELIQQIRNEEDVVLELSASPLYDNPKNNFHKDSGLVPTGEFAYMLEFFSDLIGYDDETYQGAFGLNSRYIKDAMKLITKVENRAKEIEEKYADKGVKVTINGMNDGCEYGMAVYVWIPYQ